MIPQHIIEQVRDRTDVVEIVGQYVDLKRAGAVVTPYTGQLLLDNSLRLG